MPDPVHHSELTWRQRIARLLDSEPSAQHYGPWLNHFIVLLIALNLIAIVIESVASIHQQYRAEFWAFEVFSVSIFTLEYLARVWSCVDGSDARYQSGWRGRLRYIFSPLALIDLIAIVPFYLSLYLQIDLRFLRILRLLRIFKLTRHLPAFGILLAVLRKESDALVSAMLILSLMLLIAASGIYLLESEVQPQAFASIPQSMWWAMATLTTVGYGDVVPITPLGKLFGGLIGLIGIGMVALPAAILASGFAEQLQLRRQRYNRYLQHALSDGEIDDAERWQLELLRRELGLESAEAIELLDEYMRRRENRSPSVCPHCGEPIESKDAHSTPTKPDVSR